MKRLLKERLVLSLLTLLMPLGLLAQDIKVQGVVKDETGETVIGASVMQKGTTNGAVTDIDGNFSLTVPSKATLVVSYIGFTTQEIAVGGRTQLEITLKEDDQTLNEVVVVGYGTMDKKELTSAISHVGEKDFLTVSSLDGISGEWKVRDLWQHADEGMTSTLSATLPAHGCKVVMLTK